MSANTAHRPGPFKQQNKKHSHGRHRSKRSIDAQNKGRKVDVKSLTLKAKQGMRRQERRNQAKQIRQAKKDEVLNRKRALGTESAPPILVGILAMGRHEDPSRLLDLILHCDENAKFSTTSQNIHNIVFPRFKQRFTFITPAMDSVYAILDAARVCDTLLFLHSLDEVDESFDTLLALINSLGLPTTAHVISGLDSIPPKQRPDVKKSVTKRLELRFPKEKLFSVENHQEALLLVRHLGQQKIRSLTFRDKRPYLLAEDWAFDPNPDQGSEGTLKVSGYVRSQPLSVNGLVYLPCWGDFQLSQIDAHQDPYPIHNKKSQDSDIIRVEKPDPSLQESLQAEAIPDVDMNNGNSQGEDDEHLDEDSDEDSFEDTGSTSTKKVEKKKLAPGTSDYQAAWILDGDDDDDEFSGDDSESDVSLAEHLKPMEGSDESESDIEGPLQNDIETTTVADNDNYDKELDLVENALMHQKYKQEREEQMFPDEVDVPPEVPASQRFAKYRGLKKTFQQEEWDPNENLPADYSRIYDIQNYTRLRKKVLAEKLDGCQPGTFVTLHIKNVPSAFFSHLKKNHPLPIFGLLPHEHKLSVVHITLERVPDFKEPIKSKDRLTFLVGFRTFSACPIFSGHTRSNNFKFERFLPHEGVVMASMFAPIMMTKCPVLVLKQDEEGYGDLVAKGYFHSVNSCRIILKRAALTGHCFKIHKRSVVVRFMFHNREDIEAFKHIRLRTSKGHIGDIKEPLGTHGHMKCVFDKKLSSNDIVYMHLYKRVFPKWSYDPLIHNSIKAMEDKQEVVEMEQA